MRDVQLETLRLVVEAAGSSDREAFVLGPVPFEELAVFEVRAGVDTNCCDGKEDLLNGDLHGGGVDLLLLQYGSLQKLEEKRRLDASRDDRAVMGMVDDEEEKC